MNTKQRRYGMISYEVIEFYYGNWGGSCGKFDQLHDAIERKQLLDSQKEV